MVVWVGVVFGAVVVVGVVVVVVTVEPGKLLVVVVVVSFLVAVPGKWLAVAVGCDGNGRAISSIWEIICCCYGRGNRYYLVYC